MIESSRPLDDFEADYQRTAYAGLSYQEALALFGALWAEARALNPALGDDWAVDLAPDLAVARAVNGLPPASSEEILHLLAQLRGDSGPPGGGP